ncbi:probable cytochrome P450 313a4 [Teleopsis dalmanni]|uniref:probable cytochrome P450 313a4 n=1 Tax=Teleopsis dalmanni TaxID=139649 RepID=UPI0018CF8C17|nr:probable cytochrome P450 313a4 [Teleopsis dalmanni]
MMLTLQLILGIAFLLWIYILWTRRKYYLLSRKLPGPLGYPILGMLLQLMYREDILPTFSKYIEIYGPVFLSWLGPIPFLVVSEPQIAQDILVSSHCVNKGIIYDALDDGTGHGLFSLKNPDWHVHRKLLNPAFSQKILLSFIPIFNENINELMRILDQHIGRGEIELTKIFQVVTLNIAAQTTMGKNISGIQNTEKQSLIKCYQCVLEHMTEMCFSPLLRYKWVQYLLGTYKPYSEAKNEIRKFIKNLIQEKLSTNTPIEEKDKNIFINIAIELLKRGDFTMQNVEDESNVIVFGAFETTANTIAYTLMMLSMFPECQEKVFEEIRSIFPYQGEFDVNYIDIKQMTYMDMVINETMRVMAPVPLVARQTAEDIHLSNGAIVPKGVQVVIDIFHMHRRKDIWGDEAWNFNPENFLPTNLEEKHSYAFMPFTKGLRNCIGWKYGLISVKITLAKLLRNYRFTTNFKYKDLAFVEDITLKFKETPLFQVFRREN